MSNERFLTVHDFLKDGAMDELHRAIGEGFGFGEPLDPE